ncbi:MAG: polymorphic toxin type 44 domain-containing protein [Eubacteriales bacterium]|nr:polymorphic toxin type 44 domain-containing protein [Eubacteriales bacterium]
MVVGRIRNESNNVWLVTSDGHYIFIDNMAFDFGTALVQAYQLSCAEFGAEEPITLSAFYDTFANGGPFDLKNDKHLGYKSDYSVTIGGRLLDEKFKGEELGNILYGYVASAAGFDEENIIQLGGTAVALANKDILGAASCAIDVDNCDSKDDVSNIRKGIEYYCTGNVDSLY